MRSGKPGASSRLDGPGCTGPRTSLLVSRRGVQYGGITIVPRYRQRADPLLTPHREHQNRGTDLIAEKEPMRLIVDIIFRRERDELFLESDPCILPCHHRSVPTKAATPMPVTINPNRSKKHLWRLIRAWAVAATLTSHDAMTPPRPTLKNSLCLWRVLEHEAIEKHAAPA